MGPAAALATVVVAVGHVAIGVTAGDRLDAVGDGLALLSVQHRIEARGDRQSRAGAPPRSSPAANAADSTKLPPASAGTNGTTAPHSGGPGRAAIFAHSRGGSGANAILLTGIALAPPGAPAAVQGAIDAANTIVGRPYIWGGGHGSFYSRAYDCSGSVSFALFGGGLIPRPLTSTELEHWGLPGPGRWITVYANPGHTFAEIAGLRWDTVGDEQGTGPRWHLAIASTAGFVVRHPPGL